MINFGEVSDSVSRTCRHAWSRGIKAGHVDALKDDIEGCDATKGPAMHQKSMGSPAAVLVPLSICGLLSVILVAFACYFDFNAPDHRDAISPNLTNSKDEGTDFPKASTQFKTLFGAH